MNREKRNRSTGGSSMIKTKSLRPSSGVTAHRRGGHERRDRGDQRGQGGEEAFQIIQWLNSTKLFFLTESSKMEKIYIHNIKKIKTIVSSPAVYHVGIM